MQYLTIDSWRSIAVIPNHLEGICLWSNELQESRVKIHHLRNATSVIETGDNWVLVDPMLGAKGTLPAFARFRHTPRRNPLVDLPDGAQAVLRRVTHCLITHSQAFGLRALQHTDHLDAAGEAFLRRRGIPVVCPRRDAAYLRKQGLTIETALTYDQPRPFLEGAITAVPARHGHGWIHRLMANGAGFFIQLPGEPSIYISGDTVYTPAVERVLRDRQPRIAVAAAGSARLDVGEPILMTLEEILAFARTAPGTVIANHLEALNHCPTTRTGLRQALEANGLRTKVVIPEDGETLACEA
jgi:L-ascorbate metabolism protein UlaG (beta-lactamase superfamily)